MNASTAIDWQPRLQGELIEIRPLLSADWDALLQVAADPLLWAQHPEPDRHRPEVFRRYFDSGIASGGALAVHERRSGALIGSSRFCAYSAEASSVEIGYTFLARRCWGGAFNRELKRLMLTHALSHVGKVYFVVGQHNHRSQAAMRKLGAALVPRQEHEALPLPGDLSTSVVFLVTRDLFERTFGPPR